MEHYFVSRKIFKLLFQMHSKTFVQGHAVITRKWLLDSSDNFKRSNEHDTQHLCSLNRLISLK